MRRRVIFVFIITLVLGLGCADAENTRILTGSEYFEAAHRLIGEAKESVDAAMYIINVESAPQNRGHVQVHVPGFPAAADDNPASTLLEDLISAQRRGIPVKVILDDSALSVNYNAYKRLHEAGVNVLFDTSRAVLHGKALAVDSRFCLIGSVNWSRASLKDNYEFAVLLDDPSAAAGLIKAFSGIEVSSQPPPEPQTGSGVPLAASLLTGPPKPALSNLFSGGSQKAFDLFLYLLKKRASQKSPEIKIDYAELGRAIGYTGNYYFNVFQPLRKLVSRYKLIRHKPWSKFLELDEPAGGKAVYIPAEYWDYGYDRQWSFPEKYLCLIALCEAQNSNRNPYWFRSNQDISRIYGISLRSVTEGISALEKDNVLEVYRHRPEDLDDFSDRPANNYRLNPLPAPGQFEQGLKRLAEAYGPEAVEEAQQMSAQLDEPRDLEKIETYCKLIQQYGLERVRSANLRASKYRRESGFRDISQVILILQSA